MSQKTVKLYDLDSYLKTFTAFVQECTKSGDSFRIVLDRTAFFPEGGGQYADTGMLGDAKVLDVQTDATGIIRHYTDKALPVGAEVTGSIHWEQRFRRMQEHSGEHIVSGLVHSLFGYDNIGFHLSNTDLTCDYNGLLTEAQLALLEEKANLAVAENSSITAEYPDPSLLPSLSYRSKLELTEDVRLVTIEGIDVCACCAPHVRSTGCIGLIKIVNTEKVHGGTRLHLKCGFSALADYREKQEQLHRIIEATSSRQYETADAVEKLVAKNDLLSVELARANRRIAEVKVESMAPVKGNLVLCLEQADTETLRTLANGGREKCDGLCVALTPAGNGYRYMITAKGLPLSALAKDMNGALQGRGGGKDNMIQGSFGATLQEIEAFFKTYRP